MIADLSQGRTPRQISGKDGASACATLVERTTRYLITRGPASGAQGRPGLLRAHTPHPRPTRGCDANTDMGPRPRNGPPPAPHPRHWRGGVFRSPPQKHSTNSLLPPIDTAPPQPNCHNKSNSELDTVSGFEISCGLCVAPALPGMHYLKLWQLNRQLDSWPCPDRSNVLASETTATCE